MKNPKQFIAASAVFAASVGVGAIGVNLFANGIEAGQQSQQLTDTLHELPHPSGDIAERALSANEHSLTDEFIGVMVFGLGAGGLILSGIQLRKSGQ